MINLGLRIEASIGEGTRTGEEEQRWQYLERLQLLVEALDGGREAVLPRRQRRRLLLSPKRWPHRLLCQPLLLLCGSSSLPCRRSSPWSAPSPTNAAGFELLGTAPPWRSGRSEGAGSLYIHVSLSFYFIASCFYFCFPKHKKTKNISVVSLYLVL
jgi:hypothetical protein